MLTTAIEDHYRSMHQLAPDYINYMLNQDDKAVPINPDHLPACLKPENFEFPMAPWPVLIGEDVGREMALAATRVHNLILSVPERIFDNDPERIAQYYKIRNADFWRMALSQPNGMDGMFTRGDYIHNGETLKCVELNCSAKLGGFEIPMSAPAFAGQPATKRFLEQQGLKPDFVAPLEAASNHIIDDCIKHGLAKKGVLNIGIFIDRQYVEPAKHLFEAFDVYFNRVMKAKGLKGGLLVVSPEDLSFKRSWFKELCFANGVRLHGFLEVANVRPPMEMAKPYKTGQIRIYNGLATELIGDKRNLALLSEQDENDAYTAEERAHIQRYIPWSRRVRKGQTRFRGERIDLSVDLKKLREHLVLKPADGLQGDDVYVGMFTPSDVWDKVVDEALADERGAWLAQELVRSQTYLFPDPSGEISEHDMIWGLFAMGDQYGGCFMRIQPREGADGIINTHKGARETIVLRL